MTHLLHTTALHILLDRMRAGDPAAQDELLRRIAARMKQLCRKMLQGFGQLQPLIDTDDVMQNASVRLLRSLAELRPVDMRAFFGLVAAQVRRELHDLARYNKRARRAEAKHTISIDTHGDPDQPALQLAAAEENADELERWAAFHAAVPQLPAKEREVFELLFYNGWKQVEVARLLQCDERTVRNRWYSACIALQQALGSDMPQL